MMPSGGEGAEPESSSLMGIPWRLSGAGKRSGCVKLGIIIFDETKLSSLASPQLDGPHEW
jgi:hypothetical protein